jgi:signal peptidase II
MTPRGAAWARAGIVAGLVVAADQLTKAWVVANVDRGSDESIFFGISLTNVRNDGIAFGALSGGGLALKLLVAAALVLLVVFFALHAERPLVWLPVGALLGGALGNVADRVREGAVIDFIDPAAWPAFNIADVAITLGLLGLAYVLELRRERDADEHSAAGERAAADGA